MNHKDVLVDLGACKEAINWYADRDSEEAYAACERGDWLLWVVARLKLDRKLIVLAACDCAQLAMIHVPAGEDRPQQAIDTTRAWCRGEASLKDVSIAAAAAASAAAWAAADTTWAAARTAADAAKAAALCKCADLVRARIPWAMIEKQLQSPNPQG